MNESASIGRSARGGLLYRVAAMLEEMNAPPVLLVLDTLEELTTDLTRQAVMRWVNAVADAFGPAGLRCILSGRLYDDALEWFRHYVGKEPIIDLHELEPEAALALLRRHDVKESVARQIVESDLLPRRPLELKLLARLVTRGGTQTLKRLERAIAGTDKGADDAIRALIYQRILHRLKQPLVRHIAAPGLVLRYVTPELVRDVLVPALRLPYVAEEEVREALDELAQHTWLVSRDPSGRLWHRRDLRRSTLKLMLADRKQRAQRVSKAAADYFALTGGSDDQAEAIYHRLLLTTTPDESARIDLDLVKAAEPSIRTDEADLPQAARALLRFAAGKELAVSDLVLLPDDYFFPAYHSTGERLVQQREWQSAAQLVRRGSHAGPAKSSSPLARWEADTNYTVGRWTSLSRARVGPLDSMTGIVDLAHLADRLYPYSLVGLPHVRAELIRWLDRIEIKQIVWGDRDVGTLIPRLVAGLVACLGGRKPSPAARANLRVLFKRLTSYKRSPRSAVVDQRLFLLGLLAGERTVLPLHLSPTTLVLRRTHLELVAALDTTRHVHAAVRQCVTELWDQPMKQRPTAELALTTVDGMQQDDPMWRSSAFRPTSRTSAALACYLRGGDQDFREPVRYAILSAHRTPTSYVQLWEVIRRYIDIPLKEFEGDSFVAAVRQSPEETLERYVELIDRSWNLPPFVEAMARLRPRSQPIAQVARAINRWDLTVWKLIGTRFPRLAAARTERRKGRF